MEEDLDLIYCPNCFEQTAEITTFDWRGEVAYCTCCKYMWKELIEPSESDSKTNKNFILKYIGDEENIFDIFSEDKERYNDIIDFSGLMKDNSLNSERQNLIHKKQLEYYKNKATEKSKYEFQINLHELNDFIQNPSKENIKTIFFILEHKCGLPGFIFEENSYENVTKLAYKSFNVNALKMYGVEIEELEIALSKIGVSLVFFDNNKNYTQEEIDMFKNNILINNNKEDKHIVKVIEESKKEIIDNNKKDISNSVEDNIKNITLENKEFDDFLSLKTTYGCSVEELYEIISDCTPISSLITTKPFIIPIEEYFDKYIECYISFPSLIDYDNKIVFIHISHKYLIEEILENCFEDELENNWSYDEREELFHKKINATQIYVNTRNRDNTEALMLSNSNRNNSLKETFLNLLKENKINYNIINIKNNSDEELVDFFTVLNKVNDCVSGEVYFPKENEEEIPEGKILIIPTATEEYFLPSLSNMNGKGCIITEKGSKTSHIIVMSKEFDFNVILVSDAMKKFKEGDRISIDFEDLVIYKE